MSLRPWLAGVALLLPVVLVGCGSSAAPVARLEIEPAGLDLAYPGIARIQLQWTMMEDLGPGPAEPQVFVHLLDESGGIVRTFDHPFPGSWQKGRSQEYEINLYQSALAPPLLEGTYQLSVGLYDSATGSRWPLSVVGEEVAELEYNTTEVRVLGEDDEAPMFFFSPEWQSLEGGADRQILGRRWLTGQGSLSLEDIPSSGALWLVLRIPAVNSETEELVLEPDAEQQILRMSCDCADVKMSFSGPGIHEAYFHVDAGDAGELPERCEIRFEPNFHTLRLDNLDERSVGLDILAWAPGEEETEPTAPEESIEEAEE